MAEKFDANVMLARVLGDMGVARRAEVFERQSPELRTWWYGPGRVIWRQQWNARVYAARDNLADGAFGKLTPEEGRALVERVVRETYQLFIDQQGADASKDETQG